tara:strand:- start:288 stop:452 length:165 start_codon:yes stop_codon:yes gene_type:complete
MHAAKIAPDVVNTKKGPHQKNLVRAEPVRYGGFLAALIGASGSGRSSAETPVLT